MLNPNSKQIVISINSLCGRRDQIGDSLFTDANPIPVTIDPCHPQ